MASIEHQSRMSEEGNFVTWILGILLGLAKLLIGYLFHKNDVMNDKLGALQEKHGALATKIAEEYVPKEDFKAMDQKLDRILEKLDQKADKPTVR